MTDVPTSNEKVKRALEYIQLAIVTCVANGDERSRCHLQTAIDYLQDETSVPQPSAYLKEWPGLDRFDKPITCRRVDLHPECEPWLTRLEPKITPLYARSAVETSKNQDDDPASLVGSYGAGLVTAKAQKDCNHETIRFGSGDYYVFCQDCPAAWVFKDRFGNTDEPCAAKSNQGVGGQLSGQPRIVRPENGTALP